MGAIDEQILRASKEIIVKMIETGRVYPASFNETFNNVYQTISTAVKGTDNALAQKTEDEI